MKKQIVGENFWNKLDKPFFCLAPMEDVTDVVFRQVIERAAPPDVFWTEFMNVSGFCHPEGRKNVVKRLETYDSKVPLVAQIWGTKPEEFAETTAELIKMNKFVGIDINMGCPDKSVVKIGGGAGLIKTPELAVEIIQAVKQCAKREKSIDPDRAVRVASGRGTPNEAFAKQKFMGEEPKSGPEHPEDEMDFPVSVKTRLGYSKIDEWKPWLTTLLEQKLDALTIHLRTKKEMSKVSAHYELIPDIIKLRDKISPETILIFNGDISSISQGRTLWGKNPGIDGFMIGRGVFANPFCFEKTPQKHSKEELIELLKYHLDLFDKHKKEKYEPLKKFFKIYINNFPGAADLRTKLMNTKSTKEARKILAK